MSGWKWGEGILSEGNKFCSIFWEPGHFSQNSFLSPQDSNCCGKAANGTGCCHSKGENSMVSWTSIAVTSTCNVVLMEFFCISRSSGHTVLQISRDIRAGLNACLLENSAILYVWSSAAHYETGFREVFPLGQRGATLRWNNVMTVAIKVLPAFGILQLSVFLWKQI